MPPRLPKNQPRRVNNRTTVPAPDYTTTSASVCPCEDPGSRFGCQPWLIRPSAAALSNVVDGLFGKRAGVSVCPRSTAGQPGDAFGAGIGHQTLEAVLMVVGGDGVQALVLGRGVSSILLAG
jgi:hypothetical protein